MEHRSQRMRQVKNGSILDQKNDAETDNDDDNEREKRRINESVQKCRLAMLLESDVRPENHRELLKKYTKYDYSYTTAILKTRGDAHAAKRLKARGEENPSELLLDRTTFLTTRKFDLDHRISSDPRYLAPFGIEYMADELEESNRISLKDIDESKLTSKRQQQGNCLLTLPCPCPPCREKSLSQRSWFLFHPKGPCLDRICASNLVPPNGRENAGHIYKAKTWREFTKLQCRNATKRALLEISNELCLDGTILEIKQSGTWSNECNPECVVVARTDTHISVLKVSVMKPCFRKITSHAFEDKYEYEEDVCWGNYVLKEKKRIDLRSLSSSFPSFRPVSLACHPKYGNALSDAMFAFTSHSDRRDFNVIHHALSDAEEPTNKHTITCLKHISFIDFTRTHPMCLWSAATSYVRPALSRDIQFKQPILAQGTSLHTIDLRSNSAVFQWSPSAQESLTEGVHSISGILTDWQRDNTVFVTSKSAQKTWEIDARMTCQPVNTWSLCSSCDDAALNFQQNGLYGDGSLLTRPYASDIREELKDSILMNVDTTPGAFGFHIYQQPENRPRFQTDSLECIATPGLDFTKDTSIATSSVFALPEAADDVYVCGLSSFRVPFSTFVSEDDLRLTDYANENSEVLCALTMTNTGDLYYYSLLESNDAIENCRHVPDLPVGSKVIRIPHELDGKTKDLDLKHWKATGGMDLKLYLTNQYPTPLKALLPPERKSGTKKRILMEQRKKKRKHPSLNIARKAPVYEMNSARTGVAIASGPNVEHLTQDEPVAIPLQLVESSKRTMEFGPEEEVDLNTLKDSTGRSDLSPGILRNASSLWDGEDSDTEDENYGQILV